MITSRAGRVRLALVVVVLLAASCGDAGRDASTTTSGPRTVADVLAGEVGGREDGAFRTRIGTVQRDLRVDGEPASVGRFEIAAGDQPVTLDLEYDVDIDAEGCDSPASCELAGGEVTVELAVFANGLTPDRLTVTSTQVGLPAALPGQVEADLSVELPPLPAGLNCVVLLTTLRIVGSDGDLVPPARADSSRAVLAGGAEPSNCDLLAGAEAIDLADTVVTQQGTGFDCGAIRLLPGDGRAPLADASACDHDSALLVLRLDGGAPGPGDYHLYRLPAQSVEGIVQFTLPDPLTGTWQPILFPQPDELETTAAPSHVITTWPGITFEEDG